jgi:hypothetical protein
LRAKQVKSGIGLPENSFCKVGSFVQFFVFAHWQILPTVGPVDWGWQPLSDRTRRVGRNVPPGPGFPALPSRPSASATCISPRIMVLGRAGRHKPRAPGSPSADRSPCPPPQLALREKLAQRHAGFAARETVVHQPKAAPPGCSTVMGPARTQRNWGGSEPGYAVVGAPRRPIPCR